MTGVTTIYQIYVDAFARGASDRSEGRKRGGDLEGVLERLDYVAGLGADAIWLTPIFAADSDHGYNITDYFRVDPRLAPPGH
jgi:glycosidase